MSTKFPLIPSQLPLFSGGGSSSQNSEPTKESDANFAFHYKILKIIANHLPSPFSERDCIAPTLFGRLKNYAHNYQIPFEPTKACAQKILANMEIEHMQRKFCATGKTNLGTRRKEIQVVESEKKLRRSPQGLFEIACSTLLDLVTKQLPRVHVLSHVESYIQNLDFESLKIQDEKAKNLLSQLDSHTWTIAQHVATLWNLRQLEHQANLWSSAQMEKEFCDLDTFRTVKTFFDRALQIRKCMDAVLLDDLLSLLQSIAPFANTPFNLNRLEIQGIPLAEYVVKSTKHPEMILLLHNSGVRFDGLSRGGDILANLAVKAGKADLLEPLKIAGAPLDCDREHIPILLEPPVIHAIRLNKIECLKTLANLGANVQSGFTNPANLAITLGRTECLEFLATKIDLRQIKDVWGNSLVQNAVDQGQVDCLKVLATRLVNLNAGCMNKAAAVVAIEKGKADCLQVLADADRRVRLDHSLIDFAILKKQVKCLEVLLARSEVVNQRNEMGETPATLAVDIGAINCIEVLAAGGVDMNATNKWGHTPATLAVRTRKVDCLMALVGKANLNASNEMKRSPATTAVECNQIDCLRALAGKVNLNAPDASGDTPATLAVWLGKNEFLPILRVFGADLEAQDANNLTPAACAVLLRKEREFEKEGIDILKGEQIIQAKHTASVLDPQNPNFPQLLEGKLLSYQMQKIREYMQAWLDTDLLPTFEASDKGIILNALTPRISTLDIFEEISHGRPVVLGHSFRSSSQIISFVIFEDKMMICNRRVTPGFGHSGIQCFSCPPLRNPLAAKRMIQEVRNIEEIETLQRLFNHFNCNDLYLLEEPQQNSGTCSWSNLESGILGLFSCVLEKRIANPIERQQKAQELHATFTAFVRQKCLELAPIDENSELS